MSESGTTAPVDPAERREVIADSLGVAVATGVYGISLGAVGVAAGLSVVQTCVTSLLVFTGASQFAMIGVLASGGAPMTGAATALMLGTRNTLYGLKLASLLHLRGARRVAGAHFVIDESTAMALRPTDPRLAKVGFAWTGLGIFVLWNIATLIGAVAGDAIGDPSAYGLDAAVPAAFVGLLWGQLQGRRALLAAGVACVLALGLVPFLQPGLPIIATALVAVVAAVLPDDRGGGT